MSSTATDLHINLRAMNQKCIIWHLKPIIHLINEVLLISGKSSFMNYKWRWHFESFNLVSDFTLKTLHSPLFKDSSRIKEKDRKKEWKRALRLVSKGWKTLTLMFRDSIHEARHQLDTVLPDRSPHTAQIMSRVCLKLLKRRKTKSERPGRKTLQQIWTFSVMTSCYTLLFHVSPVTAGLPSSD